MNPDDPLGLINPPQSGNDPLGLMAAPKAPLPAPKPEEPEMGYAGRLATHVLNAAQGIPGMEAFEAAAGSLGSKLTDNPMSYQESLDALRGMTSQIGGGTSAVEHALGTVPLLPFLPANPAAAGALLGGGDAALSADTDQSLAGRALRTAVGAGVGAAVGKGADMAVGAARGLLATPASAQLLKMQANRALSAKALYGQALAEGRGQASPPIQNYLKEPDVAEIVSELKNTREFQNVAEDSPEMLDAVYKTLSDRLATVNKGLLAVNPSKPNIGRFQAKNIKAAQEAGLQAMDETMPTYREAVKDFAQKKAAEDALNRGYEAVRSSLAENLPAARNLTRTTGDAFSKWIQAAGPDESHAVVQGILGGVKMAAQKSLLTAGRKAASKAPGLLRAAGDVTAVRAPRVGLLALRDLY